MRFLLNDVKLILPRFSLKIMPGISSLSLLQSIDQDGVAAYPDWRLLI